eukprot:COSAG05_NODE_73_length_21807_cov_283.593698_14_plen_105_part_00
MHNVIAPTTGNATNQAKQCAAISTQLRDKYKIQIYVGAAPGGTIPCFLRVHAQIYLELSDYKRLAEAVLEILGKSNSSEDEADTNSGGFAQRMGVLGGVSAVEQ